MFFIPKTRSLELKSDKNKLDCDKGRPEDKPLTVKF